MQYIREITSKTDFTIILLSTYFCPSQLEKYYSKNAYYACHGQVDKKYISRSSVTPFRAELRRILCARVVSLVSISIHNHKHNQRVKTYFSNGVFMYTILYIGTVYKIFFITFSRLLRTYTHLMVVRLQIIVRHLINQMGRYF